MKAHDQRYPPWGPPAPVVRPVLTFDPWCRRKPRRKLNDRGCLSSGLTAPPVPTPCSAHLEVEYMNDHQHRLRRCGSTQPAAWMRARGRQDPVDPWRLIQRRHSGLLRYARARGAVALPVLYAARDRRLYVRLPVYNDACNFLDRADVALDVDASSAGRISITRVSGTGLMIPDALPTGLSHTLRNAPRPADPGARARPESVRQLPLADDVRTRRCRRRRVGCREHSRTHERDHPENITARRSL